MNNNTRSISRMCVGNLATDTLRNHPPTKIQINITNAMMGLLLLSSVSTTFAFCPSEIIHQTSSSMDVPFVRISANFRGTCPQRSRLPSVLFSTNEEDNENGMNSKNNELSESNIPHEYEDDDEIEDIIIQKLHRNAQRGPIDPMKEHDKMLKENQDEALNITSTKKQIRGIDDSLFNSSFYRTLMASYINPDIDVTDSHDEHYVDEQFYELLSRDGDDLANLGPGITTVPLDPTSEEGRVEKNLEQKEGILQKVVRQVSSGEGKWDREKIEEAQKLKAEIDRMHIDDCGAVLLANLAFYEAFSARDTDWMNDVWWHSPSIICVHPSHEPLIGSKAVLNSFNNMFASEFEGKNSRGEGTKSAPNVFMSPANIRALSVRGTTASLVCDEDIFEKAPNEYSGRLIVNKLLTTNVFRKIGGKWKMVHRHASWHPWTLSADAAMKAKPGFAPVKTEREIFNENLTKKRTFNDNLEKKRMAIKKLNGDGISTRPADLQKAPASLDGLNANNVVGVPEEKVKPKKAKKSSSEDDLLRILGISSGDDEDDEEEEEEDDDDSESNKGSKPSISLSDLLSGDKGESTTTGSGTPDDPFVTRRIIRIGPEQFNKLAEQGKLAEENDTEINDGEDENEANVVIDLSNKSEQERKRILEKVFPDQVDTLMKTIKEREIDDEENNVPRQGDMLINTLNKEKKTETLTQKCINAIRQLSDQGQLSSKQKRILLTDIIASSARGETSMVEVAYELLLSQDSEPGMEDFTEQCRVFASASMDGDEFGVK